MDKDTRFEISQRIDRKMTAIYQNIALLHVALNEITSGLDNVLYLKSLIEKNRP